MATGNRDAWGATVFAFRGYNVANLGRTRELARHPQYGARVRAKLDETSRICSDLVGRPVDLLARVEREEETDLDSFDEAIALILAAEIAQIELLHDCIGANLADAKFAFGYSLGEIAALITAGVFDLEAALKVLMGVAAQCAELAHDVHMGVVFTRGPKLDLPLVTRTCEELTVAGPGVVAVSSILAPNSVLVLGQGDRVAKVRKELLAASDGAIHVRQNQHLWPPLHTPILWDRGLSNLAGSLMLRISGSGQSPAPRVMSLAAPGVFYNDFNFRELLYRWMDHPQRLWDAVEETLRCGAQTVVHVGPAPNLIPATFRRLSDNVIAQTRGYSLRSWGMWAAQRNRWLAGMLISDACLLRAPLVRHLVLEDWLLSHPDAACPSLRPIEAVGETETATEAPAAGAADPVS